MRNPTEFINTSVADFSSISFLDSIRSSFPIFFLMGFVVMYIGGMVGFFSNVRGAAWGIMMMIIFAVILATWLKLFQYYEKKTTLKKKVFRYRISQAMVGLGPELTLGKPKKMEIKAVYNQNNHKTNLVIGYDQNLLRNIGGIIPGTPLALPSNKQPHSETWFLKIQGTTDLFQGQQLEFDFSSRKNDFKGGKKNSPWLYDLKSKKEILPMSAGQAAFCKQIQKAIEGSIIKGSLELENGQFLLKVFDNILTINRWKKPVIKYRHYQSVSRSNSSGVAEEQVAFFGMDKILALLENKGDFEYED